MSPNKNYTNGRNREYQIKHYLESKGFTCYRTAGSHSQVDIIALSKSQIYFIQSKKGKLSDQKKIVIKAMMPQSGYIYASSIAVDDDWKEILGDL